MTRSIATLTDITGDLTTELASVRSYQRSSKAKQTVRVYDQAWRSFTSWCQTKRREALPADPETVAAYLAQMANVGYSYSTIGIHRAAVSAAHRAARLYDPSTSEDVRDTVDGISRRIGTRKRGSDAIMPDDLLAMVRACDRSTLPGQRDAALLIVGWFGGFRRSELVSVGIDDVRIQGDAMTIVVKRSKTDQSGQGLTKHFPRLEGHELCPIAAVRAWRSTAGLTEGPLFRRIERDGDISSRAARRGGLTDQYVDRLIKRLASAAQIITTDDGGRRRFSGHSLRVGLLTAADEAGVAVESMSKQVGHRKIDTTLGYQRKGGASIRRGIASIFKTNGSNSMKTERREVTRDQYMAEAIERFGPDPMNWRFVCPVCGHVASTKDYKDAGAPESAVAFSCVGRWIHGSKDAFEGSGRGPCTYAGAGLIRLNPVSVTGWHEAGYFELAQSIEVPA